MDTVNNGAEEALAILFEKWHGAEPEHVVPIAADGSNRSYYRLKNGAASAIGVYNDDSRENAAFVQLSRHFQKYALPVPEIYAVDSDRFIYFQQDLGDTTLFRFLDSIRTSENDFPVAVHKMYRKVLSILPQFQIIAGRDIDYAFCCSRTRFDEQSILWDFQYFKYCFLKLLDISHNEERLERDFVRFADLLMESPHDSFLYRDLQSRNIMIQNDEPYFIDYQGGRRGALEYDVASLLYDPRANIPLAVRNELVNYYLDVVGDVGPFDRSGFLVRYHGYAIIRICQALGTYGFRGLYEQKTHFLRSIAPMVQNIESIIDTWPHMKFFPALERVFHAICTNDYLRNFAKPSKKLTIRIGSFSYQRGIPRDEKGHGGGFVDLSIFAKSRKNSREIRKLNGA